MKSNFKSYCYWNSDNPKILAESIVSILGEPWDTWAWRLGNEGLLLNVVRQHFAYTEHQWLFVPNSFAKPMQKYYLPHFRLGEITTHHSNHTENWWGGQETEPKDPDASWLASQQPFELHYWSILVKLCLGKVIFSNEQSLHQLPLRTMGKNVIEFKGHWIILNKSTFANFARYVQLADRAD